MMSEFGGKLGRKIVLLGLRRRDSDEIGRLG
jgi:hypothetical protein